MTETIAAEDKDLLKTALKLAKSRELHCAAGAGGKAVAIRLHASTSVSTLRRELQQDKGLTKLAIGTAIRADSDQTHLVLSLDKDMPGGFCKRLALQLRFAGVRIVTIKVDDIAVQSGGADEEEEEQAAPGSTPITPEIADRLRSAAAKINALPPLDSRSAGAQVLFAQIRKTMVETRGVPLAQLAELEQLVAGPVPQVDVFTQGVKQAHAELRAAGEEARGPEGERMFGLIDAMKVAAAERRYDAAAGLCNQARSQAIQILAGAEQQAADEKLLRLVAPTLAAIKASTFTAESIQALKALHPGRTFTALIEAEKKCAGQPTQEACQAVADAAEKYLRHFDADLKPKEQQSQEGQAKKQAAKDALSGARRMTLALAFEELGPTPWNKAQQLKAAQLRTTFAFENMNVSNDQGGMNQPGLVATPFTGSSNATFQVTGRPLNGRPSDEQSLMVFKPAKGERTEYGYPKGGSAPREVLTYALSESVAAMTGLRLGCPETNLVSVAAQSIDVAGFNALPPPALYAGEPIVLNPTAKSFAGSVQQFAASAGELDKFGKGPEGRAVKGSIAADDCHRVAILDILSLNLDRHGGNLLVENPAGGVRGIVPIDHGLAFPSIEALEERLPIRLNDPSTNVLLSLPSAFKPLSADLQSRLQMLDPGRLRVALGQSRAVMAQSAPELGVEETVSNKALDLAARSALFLKLAAPRLSPAVIQIAMAAEWEALFASADKEAFEAAAGRIVDAYAGRAGALTAIYTALDVTLDDMGAELARLGWIPASGQPIHKAKFRQWLARNPERALELFRAGTRAPSGRTPGYEPA